MFRERVFVGLLVALFASFHLTGGQAEPSGSQRSVSMQGAPLQEALAATAAMDGKALVLRGNAVAHRVSVVLENGRFEQNLKRVMRGLNYALASSPDGTVIVWIFDAADDDPGADTMNAQQPALPRIPPASLFPDSPMLAPPGEEGDGGYTEADVAYYRSWQTPVDPMRSHVVPPDDSGMIPTQDEMQRITAARTPLGPDALVLPPAFPGEAGVTMQELAQMRRFQLDLREQPGFWERVPPD